MRDDRPDDLARRVSEVLETIEHATIATVSAEGMPWNTPVYFARQGRSSYWISRRDAQHSINIGRNRRAFIVVFDSSGTDASGAGVYIDAAVDELTDDDDRHRALELIYRRRG